MTCLYRAIHCGAAALAICLSSSISVLAEEVAALQEVVVTAEKRTENLQNVPIAVTVVSGDAFTKANVSQYPESA